MWNTSRDIIRYFPTVTSENDVNIYIYIYYEAITIDIWPLIQQPSCARSERRPPRWIALITAMLLCYGTDVMTAKWLHLYCRPAVLAVHDIYVRARAMNIKYYGLYSM